MDRPRATSWVPPRAHMFGARAPVAALHDAPPVAHPAARAGGRCGRPTPPPPATAAPRSARRRTCRPGPLAGAELVGGVGEGLGDQGAEVAADDRERGQGRERGGGLARRGPRAAPTRASAAGTAQARRTGTGTATDQIPMPSPKSTVWVTCGDRRRGQRTAPFARSSGTGRRRAEAQLAVLAPVAPR